MGFTVEDGTGLSGANSYATVQFADEYFADRGNTTWTGSTVAKQTALVRATDYINTVFGKRFAGQRYTTAQALCFPRDVEGPLPKELLKATAEYALRALGNKALMPDMPTDDSGVPVLKKTEELGPIKEVTEYANTSANPIRPYPAADMLLRPLVKSNYGVIR